MGLHFCQFSDVASTQYLRTNIPNMYNLDDLETYFDSTYVSRCLRLTVRSVGNQLNLVRRMMRSAAQFHQTCGIERQRGNVGQPRAHQQRVRETEQRLRTSGWSQAIRRYGPYHEHYSRMKSWSPLTYFKMHRGNRPPRE